MAQSAAWCGLRKPFRLPRRSDFSTTGDFTAQWRCQNRSFSLVLTIQHGWVPEWSNGLAWKACELQKSSEGSNPSPSASLIKESRPTSGGEFATTGGEGFEPSVPKKVRAEARSAETGEANPSPSASLKPKRVLRYWRCQGDSGRGLNPIGGFDGKPRSGKTFFSVLAPSRRASPDGEAIP